MAPVTQSIHHIAHSAESKQLAFSNSHTPLLTVDSGSEVSFDNTSAGFHLLTASTTDDDLRSMNLAGVGDIEKAMGPIYVDGPVYIRGAEPGDTLKVEILDLETADWGWTAVFPGLGLLQDEFPGPHIKTFSLGKEHAVFKEGVVHIPAAPFYGTMGVAPATKGDDAHPLFPRNDIGGNFDCRYLGVGATMYLRVNTPGALFSVGDAHYAQGDGEITGTALETMMKSRFRLSVIKRAPESLELESPHYDTEPVRTAAMAHINDKGEHGVLATASTRDEAVKTAVRGLISWMHSVHGLTRLEGYMLFSIAGNLKTMHDVGLELHTMSASIPLGLFVDGK